ncbi:hypothetical protein EVAR_6171_1 [Eumeta japonica]|uniref:Uncharacterized protein n=1 Tax=Eumeta variegata TaxID=151549 RepID=A0A4C1THU5_EUMVA|nr:hypothetical protein EVAR_6171_1 [Eumeta japonica]
MVGHCCFGALTKLGLFDSTGDTERRRAPRSAGRRDDERQEWPQKDTGTRGTRSGGYFPSLIYSPRPPSFALCARAPLRCDAGRRAKQTACDDAYTMIVMCLTVARERVCVSILFTRPRRSLKGG